jgi:hypothetical protein
MRESRYAQSSAYEHFARSPREPDANRHSRPESGRVLPHDLFRGAAAGLETWQMWDAINDPSARCYR